MPNKVNAWESNTFRTIEQTIRLGNIFNYLPNDVFSAEEFAHVLNLGQGGDFGTATENEQQSRKSQFNNIAQVNEAGKLIIQGKIFETNIPGAAAYDLVDKTLEKAVEELRAQGTKRNDPRISRFYKDLADVHDLKSGNIAKLYFSSPYLSNLSTAMTTLVNPKGVSSNELKAQLTVPLYEAAFDFTHAIAEEIGAGLGAQDNVYAWQEESDARHLDDIYKSHANILEQYAKLKEFYDDPQEQTTAYMTKPLADLFGRNNAKGESIDAYIGMIRGENQAIRNGWSRTDMFVLGAIGGIEAEIKRQEDFIAKMPNNEDRTSQKQALLKFKTQFYQLKDSCYHQVVGSAAEKLEIANKVKAFVEASNAKDAAAIDKLCCATVANNIDKLNEISIALNATKVKEEANPDSTKSHIKIEDPLGYLAPIYAKAKESKDFDRFVEEYLDLKEKFASQPEKLNQLKTSMNHMFALDKDNLKEFHKAVANHYYAIQVEYGQMLEQKTREILEGNVKLDIELGKVDFLRKDQMFVRGMAIKMMEKSAVNKKLEGLKELFEATIVDNKHNKRGQYLTNTTDGLSKAERYDYYRQGRDHSTKLDEAFGISTDKDGNFTKPDNDKVISTIRKESVLIDKYMNKYGQLQGTIAKHLDILDKLAQGRTNNSQAFNNMITALQKVSTVTVNGTPRELNDAIINFGTAAKVYEDKINSQTFAGILTNGKQRIKESQELQKLSKEFYDIFRSIPEYISVNEPIIEQYDRIKENQKSLHNGFKDEMEANLKNEINVIIEKSLVEYSENLGPEGNKNNIAKGIANVILLSSLKQELNSQDNNTLVCSEDYRMDKLVAGSLKLCDDEGFTYLMSEIKDENSYNKFCNDVRNNPDSLLAKLNQERAKVKAQNIDSNYISNLHKDNLEIANNNNIIQNAPL